MQRADPLNSVKKHGSGSALYQPPVWSAALPDQPLRCLTESAGGVSLFSVYFAD